MMLGVMARVVVSVQIDEVIVGGAQYGAPG